MNNPKDTLSKPSLPNPPPPNLPRDLIQLYDDLAEFNDYCAFLCDAMPNLFTEDFDLDPHTIQGARRHCSDLKVRAEALKTGVADIRRQVNGVAR